MIFVFVCSYLCICIRACVFVFVYFVSCRNLTLASLLCVQVEAVTREVFPLGQLHEARRVRALCHPGYFQKQINKDERGRLVQLDRLPDETAAYFPRCRSEHRWRRHPVHKDCTEHTQNIVYTVYTTHYTTIHCL